MTISLNLNWVEFVWMAINLVTLGIVITTLRDSNRDVKAVAKLNGAIRGIHARGARLREAIRVGKVVALIAIAVPTSLRPGEIEFTWNIAMLFVLPILTLATSLSEAHDRIRIARKALADEGEAAMKRIETLAQDTKDVAIETKDRVIDLQERS